MLMIMMHLPRRRSGARLGDGLTPVGSPGSLGRWEWRAGAGFAGDGHAYLQCAPFRAIHDDPVVSSDMVFGLCVLAAAKSVLRHSYNKLEHQF